MLSARLAYLRKNKEKTQDDMAKHLGITRPAYTAYESGRRQPDYETLIKLADFFGVTTDYLLGRTDDPTPPQQKQKKPSHEEYILSAMTLADASIRIANLFNDYQIDEDEYIRLNTLAYRKFGLPPVPGAEEAAHLEHDVPGTGVFEGDKDENKSGSTKTPSKKLRYKGRL